MKKILLSAVLLCSSLILKAANGCTVSLSGLSATLSNGTITAAIGSNGRVGNLAWDSYKLLAGGGIYFDYTADKNRGMSPNKVTILQQSDDCVEVLYSNDNSNPRMKQGYIMRKGVNGLYTYIIVGGTATSSSVNIREMRVCTRLNTAFDYGYVTEAMQGTLPTVATMKAVNKTGQLQDATFRLPDGSVYTKYNWANYVAEDSVHGLINSKMKIGVWNIPCSHEWINGGPMRQELTVHTDTKSPLTIQMLQGEHFGASAQSFNEGEEKIYGPFLIYVNRKNSRAEMVADAQAEAHLQQQAWPFEWFHNSLYPTAAQRSTVSGRINLTNYAGADSLQVALGEAGGDLYTQGKRYIYWTTTNHDGSFSIPNVRQGQYSLYVYALKGDITDQLVTNNIDVTTPQTDLGTISWTPQRYTDRLFLIGSNNLRSDGFSVSDSLRAYALYDLVPASLVYEVGKSHPQTDWYYAQCHNGTWTIRFKSTKTYSGQAHLTISLAGATNKAKLQCAINGSNIGAPVSFGNDAAIYRSATQSGHHRLTTIDFDASYIQKGTNELTLTMSGIGRNGGMMYDCIKLEAGSAVTSSIGKEKTFRSTDIHPTAYFSVNGMRLNRPCRGVNIVKYSNGDTKKIIIP